MLTAVVGDCCQNSPEEGSNQSVWRQSGIDKLVFEKGKGIKSPGRVLSPCVAAQVVRR